MLEYAGSSRAGLQRQRDEGLALGGIVRSLDWLLVAGVAGLVAVGLWAISGVTQYDNQHNPSYFLDRQIAYVAVGVVALLVATLVNPDIYRRYWRAIFIATAGVIALVLLGGGHTARGSTRWITVGPFTFQPSEFGKLLFVLAIAGFIAERARTASDCAQRCGRSGSARSRSSSSSSSRTSGRHSSTWPRSARCCSSAARRGSS